MQQLQHQARKRFGQNFLQDSIVIHQILISIAAKPEHHLVEIGPGLGAITAHLLKACDRLDVVELDRDLVTILQQQFSGYEAKLAIHQGDALTFDFDALAKDNQPIRVVGNLPYNIATPLIFHLLAQTRAIADMHFMMQREVVQRLGAVPGQKHYGQLSIMVQYYCQVEILFAVPPEAFKPKPKVNSTMVRLIPHQKPPWHAMDFSCFTMVVKTAFTQRRKTLGNNLKPLLDAMTLKHLGIDPELRPECLCVAKYVQISNHLSMY